MSGDYSSRYGLCCLQAADGFLFVAQCDSGRVIYVSDSITPILNQSQVMLPLATEIHNMLANKVNKRQRSSEKPPWKEQEQNDWQSNSMNVGQMPQLLMWIFDVLLIDVCWKLPIYCTLWTHAVRLVWLQPLWPDPSWWCRETEGTALHLRISKHRQNPWSQE